MRDTIAELEKILANEQLEYEGDLLDAETTGERPDLDDREVMVPVGWVRSLLTEVKDAHHSMEFIEKAYREQLSKLTAERNEATALFEAHDELLHQCLDERDRLRAAAKSSTENQHV